MRLRPRLLVHAIATMTLALSAPVFAGSDAVTFNSLTASASAASVVTVGSNLLLNTLVTGDTGALLQTINFNVGAGVTAFTGSAAWEVTPAADTGPRLTGVNIDIFDAFNSLVASDTFAGLSGGFAISTFAGGLTPGAYRLVATGTGVRASSLDVSLSFTGAVSPLVPGPPAALVTQGVRTDVLQSASVRATALLAGDTLFLDTLVVNGETGALDQRVKFTIGAGVGGFTGNAAWEISTAAGTGPRLTGVNIDILDSNNLLVASDSFAGTLGGFATSTLLGNLAAGDYTLVATGTAVRDASLNVSLSFVPSPVPEPQTWALLAGGLVLLACAVRSRRHAIG
jgi:hypothetical protein